MAVVKKSFVVDVEITSEDMATMFANADSGYQAAFFNRVSDITEQWEKPACFQWRYMEADLTAGGAQLLRDFVEHTDVAREEG